MFLINEGFLELHNSYLFDTVNRKVKEYEFNNPDKKVIRLGIGDVTKPLAPVVINAMHNAVEEMGTSKRF